MPIVIILSVIGTYAIQNSVVDIFYMIGFGVLGYFMRLYGYATGPMELGIILGPMLDANYKRAMAGAEERTCAVLEGFVTSPISLTLCCLHLPDDLHADENIQEMARDRMSMSPIETGSCRFP